MQLATLVLCVLVPTALAGGAGRAFPIESENYSQEQFKQINPKIEWDPTNFLVDLSGHYANCDSVDQRGPITVERLTPEGHGIVGFVDWERGSEVHTNAVIIYIKSAVDRWIRESVHDNSIQGSEYFGCSVRPGCDGRVSLACLFSRAYSDENSKPEDLTEQIALAFTSEQYREAEAISGNRWDRSHFLENLSGYETRCRLMDETNWNFEDAKSMAAEVGMQVVGLYGWSENRGSTPAALEEILYGFNKEVRPEEALALFGSRIHKSALKLNL